MLDRLKKVLKTQAGMFYAILIAGVMILGTSYSIFVLSTSSITTSEILVGNMLYSVSVYEEGSATAVSNRTVTVPASSSKSYYIVLASVNNTNSNFKLAYNASATDGLTITASDRTGWDVSGLIGAYNSYGFKRIIKVNVENTGSAKTIEFNAFGGYSFNSTSKVNLATGFTALAVSTESVTTTARSLVEQIEEDLNCTATENKACLYGSSNNTANVITIKENGSNSQEVNVNYRILGVYKLGSTDGDKVVKVVREDAYQASSYTSSNVATALGNFYTNVLVDKNQIYATDKFDCISSSFEIGNCASFSSFNSNIGLITAEELRTLANSQNYMTINDYNNINDFYVLDKKYQQVEYIQSTGLNYINTLDAPGYNDSFEFEYAHVSTDTTYRSIMGAASRGGGGLLFISDHNSGRYYIDRYFASPTLGRKYKYEFTINHGASSTLKVDGVDTLNVSIQVEGLPMMLFARNANNGKAIGRMYYFKWMRSGEVLHYYVPCYRKSDGVVGMYDIVDHLFYTSSGTGDFISDSEVDTTLIPSNLALLNINNGTFEFDSANNSYIKPAFYLKNDTYVEGSGTSADPYTIGSAPTQSVSPQYYGFFEGNIGMDAPLNSSPVPPSGKKVYIGYDIVNNKISAAYACFIRNEKQYCLKGGDGGYAYEYNQTVLEEAYKNTSACTFDEESSSCSEDEPIAFEITADIYGSLGLYYGPDTGCEFDDGGYFGCFE